MRFPGDLPTKCTKHSKLNNGHTQKQREPVGDKYGPGCLMQEGTQIALGETALIKADLSTGQHWLETAPHERTREAKLTKPPGPRALPGKKPQTRLDGRLAGERPQRSQRPQVSQELPSNQHGLVTGPFCKTILEREPGHASHSSAMQARPFEMGFKSRPITNGEPERSLPNKNTRPARHKWK